MSEYPSVSQWIADYVVASRQEPVGKDIATVVGHSVADALGVAIYGSTEEPGSGFVRALSSPAGRNRVIGTALMADAANACLINGALMHSQDWDDMGGCGGHPTAALLPPLLAAAETGPTLSGTQLVRAYAIGYQVGTVLARYLIPDRPWHQSGFVGGIAGVCALGAVRHYSRDELTHGIGLAVSLASGTRASFGTSGKCLQLGHAAWSAHVASSLAAEGANGERLALERDNGLAACLMGRADWRHVSEDLWGAPAVLSDEDRYIVGFGPLIKPWPCCGGNAPALTALEEILLIDPVAATDVVSVHVSGTARPFSGALFRRRPERGLEGKFCLPYNLALLLLHGVIEPWMYSEEALGTVVESGLMEKVQWDRNDEAGETHPGMTCRVVVTSKDGKKRSAQVLGRGRRLADNQIMAKFLGCAEPVLGQSRSEELLRSLSSLSDLANVADLLLLSCS